MPVLSAVVDTKSEDKRKASCLEFMKRIAIHRTVNRDQDILSNDEACTTSLVSWRSKRGKEDMRGLLRSQFDIQGYDPAMTKEARFSSASASEGAGYENHLYVMSATNFLLGRRA